MEIIKYFIYTRVLFSFHFMSFVNHAYYLTKRLEFTLNHLQSYLAKPMSEYWKCERSCRIFELQKVLIFR